MVLKLRAPIGTACHSQLLFDAQPFLIGNQNSDWTPLFIGYKLFVKGTHDFIIENLIPKRKLKVASIMTCAQADQLGSASRELISRHSINPPQFRKLDSN